MARGPRFRIEKGIYHDRAGTSAIVQVGILTREKRFPADTDLDVLREWRARTRANLLADHRVQKAQRSDPRSLARAIAAYLKTRKGRPSHRADRSHAKPWITLYGPKRRHQVTAADVVAAIATWLAAKKSPTTIRHRVRVLREVYERLDGKTAPNPTKGVRLPVVARPTPVPVSSELIQRVATSLAKGKRHAKGYGDDPIKSRARFLVYATTGQRPSQIGRALPSDVDLERRIWFVRPAKNGHPIPLPLNDDAIRAWQIFRDADAWGAFDPTGLAKVLRRHGWPKGIRPYVMRHTLAIDLLLNEVPLEDIQGLLGHRSIETTRRFYAPILLARLTEAVKKRKLDLD